MTDAAPAPAIYGALVAIQSQLGKVEKSGRGPSSQGSYPFLPVDEIVARLAPLFAEYGVAVVPRQVSCEQQVFRFPKVNMQGDPIMDGRPDAVQLITRLLYDFTFVSAEDGSSVTTSAFGESIDTGDKGIRRAATAAYKEMLLRTFTVVAGEDDPDALDPNDQPAQVVRQNRGEQQRERAASGPTERAPRAARTPRAKKDEAAAPATPTEAAPATQEEPATTPAVEPEVAAYVESVAAKADAAEQPKAREAKTPAEQRSDDWKPDQADVDHAVANAPASTASTAAPREPKAPVAPPEPKTTEDERYNSVADVRKAIREQLEARKLDRSVANDVGDAETGKPRGQWFANLSDLRKVLAKIEELPMPSDDGSGF